MKLEDTVEYNALNWVKKELDVVLNQIRLELEAYIDDPSEQERLSEARSLMGQVQGTLQMVELYGAAMLAEEMEEVAQAIMIGEIKKKDDAFEVLMRALLQLPDYLEHIQMGHRDIPIVLLPLLNDLRATRDASLLSDNVLFFPNLESADDRAADGQSASSGEDAAALAKKLRHTFQLGLLGWFRDKDVSVSLTKLSDVLGRLRKATTAADVRRLWWTGGALAEALSLGGLESSITVKLLMGKVDRQIKQLIDLGEQTMAEQVPGDLFKNILYYVARAPSKGEQVLAVKSAFKLSELLPEGSALEAVRESMGGPNLELLSTVSQAIREDLTEVKDSLEIFVHADNRQISELEPVAGKLSKIADTLGMLGLGEPRKSVMEEAAKIQAMVRGESEADEGALTDMAGVMLNVESSINDFISGRSRVQIEVKSAERDNGLPDSEFQNVLSAVIRETLMDINKTKEAVLEYIASPQNVQILAPVPDSLEQIKGAMFMLPLDRVIPLLDAIKRYITQGVMQQRAVPGASELESLADAITSVEFYLEALAERRGDHLAILQVGLDSVAKLGFAADGDEGAAAPPPARPPEVQTPPALEIDELSAFTGEGDEELVLETPDFLLDSDEDDAQVFALDDDALTLEVEPPAKVPAAPAKPQKERPAPLVGEIDEEILEIFLEEAEEEIERIGEFLPRWQEKNSDEESLITVRRSFHTLKGSGRLVGAQLIGEFAWAFESLLNRILDKHIKPAMYVFEALNKALEALPQLVAQVKGEGDPSIDIYHLMDEAEAMSRPDYAERVLGRVDEESEADKHAYLAEEGTEPAGEFQGDPDAEALAPGQDTVAQSNDVIGADGDTGEQQQDIVDEQTQQETDSIDGDTVEFAVDAQSLDAESVDFDLLSEDWGSEQDLESDTIELELPEFAADFDLSEDTREGALGIDPALFEIFKAEAAQHLNTLELALEQARESADGRFEITDETLRALHTLNGSARTAEVSEISGIFGPLERYARAHEGLNQYLPAAVLPLLEEGIYHSCDVLDALSKGRPEVPGGQVLRERIEALLEDELALRTTVELTLPALEADTLDSAPVADAGEPQAASAPAGPKIDPDADIPGEQDMELVEIFLEEAMEIMDASDGALQAWENDLGDADAVSELQRQLHTLKGGARMAGFSNIGNLSHSVESLIIAVVDGQVQSIPAIYHCLHRTFGRLSEMLEKAQRSEPVPSAPELIRELEALRQGQEVSSIAPPPTPVSEPEPEPEPELDPTDTVELDLLSDDDAVDSNADDDHVVSNVVDLMADSAEAEAEPSVERRAASRASPQELIRVRSELLDNLVNNAGEVNIYHARLEEQITGFSFNLNELSQTVTRLREQLRKMEIETEAQIRSRYAQEHEADDDFDANFDPLEMDEFSNIQQLSRALAESVNDLVSIEDIISEQVRDTETLLLQQSRVSTDLQEGLMRTRMAQFTGTVPRLRRVVRQTSMDLNKKVDLVISGENSELDRSVLERMVAPLEHMLRNAIAHGIEPPSERKALGKSETGKIAIDISREGSEVVIRVSDDGGGLSIDAIRAKAESSGLIKVGDHLPDHDIMQLILESGFSTAESVDQISGRGVGMDVVNSEIKQLAGVLRIDSTRGAGTTFTVHLPFTLAINQALLVRSGDDVFAIPLASIEGIVRYTAGELREKYMQDEARIEYAAFSYDLKHLGSLLGMSRPMLEEPNMLFPLLLVRSGDHRMALHVEGLMGSREVVVKPVGPQMSKARGVAGATILGDGRVVLILDIPGLVRVSSSLHLVYDDAPEPEPEEARALTVMVVDDSITIRKVTARMLERNNFEVVTAKDGVEAVSELQDTIPDLMLLDIEMPRMDGYELATHMRNDKRLKNVPIIMITSRTGEKHRKRAFDIGVNRYLGKPYQESDLLENITALLKSEGRI